MKSYLSAGLIVVQDNKILLVHPRNASWWGTYSIPKGIVEPGESPWDTAIRETEEETGVRIEKRDSFCAGQIHYPDSKKSVLYFLVYPKERIEFKFKPNDEVDWAGFLSKSDALPRISPRFMEALQYIRELKRTKHIKR